MSLNGFFFEHLVACFGLNATFVSYLVSPFTMDSTYDDKLSL